MSAGEVVWGLMLIGGGIFIGVYGEILFRFVLAMIGFLAGFTALYLILDGQSEGLQVLLSFAAGGIGALLLYSLFNFGMYVAGGALGAVVGLITAALIGLNSGENKWLMIILVLAGSGSAGFFGPRLGSMIITLGTSSVAALLVVYGYVALFESTYGVDAATPSDGYSSRSLLVLFFIIFALAFLGQWNIAKLRHRLRN